MITITFSRVTLFRNNHEDMLQFHVDKIKNCDNEPVEFIVKLPKGAGEEWLMKHFNTRPNAIMAFKKVEYSFSESLEIPTINGD